ncbi:hypothetical protein HPP92_003465 [Vanilla planifolia]|uniref:Uncharacterized protein n=1 Tax=Vanilla planifolia TaxID=51239 RepID=A0A835VNH6_VANPL|nr:hypothetical protein HPP92_003465 [Vanilla planifolia]
MTSSRLSRPTKESITTKFRLREPAVDRRQALPRHPVLSVLPPLRPVFSHGGSSLQEFPTPSRGSTSTRRLAALAIMLGISKWELGHNFSFAMAQQGLSQHIAMAGLGHMTSFESAGSAPPPALCADASTGQYCRLGGAEGCAEGGRRS